jgi:hypothetical protein
MPRGAEIAFPPVLGPIRFGWVESALDLTAAANNKRASQQVL